MDGDRYVTRSQEEIFGLCCTLICLFWLIDLYLLGYW